MQRKFILVEVTPEKFVILTEQKDNTFTVTKYVDTFDNEIDALKHIINLSDVNFDEFMAGEYFHDHFPHLEDDEEGERGI